MRVKTNRIVPSDFVFCHFTAPITGDNLHILFSDIRTMQNNFLMGRVVSTKQRVSGKGSTDIARF